MRAMLTRLYIDNFRCFVDFECRFDNSNKQLIIGRNGSGKSSLFEVLLFLRQFAVAGKTNKHWLIDKTRWLRHSKQTFEIEASINDASYIYRLVIGRGKKADLPLVKSETVQFNRNSIFEFVDGQVCLYNDQFEPKIVYPFDPYRSAFATVTESADNAKLIRFKEWFSNLVCFKLNPFTISSRFVEFAQLIPEADLSNFADWYWHLERAYPEEKAVLFKSLSAAMDGFQSLRFVSVGGTAHVLFIEFTCPGKGNIELLFDQLSDGQRCLIYLYTILYFVVAKGGTVIIDEPENFLSLREIQPWLMTLTDVLDEGSGQALLISHHPEFINQWAPRYGIQLVREGAGPVYAKQFADYLGDALPPAELIARGWELE